MERKILTAALCAFLQATITFGLPMTEIRYETNEVGSGRWEYIYKVANVSLPVLIEEFTIWFDYGKYENLSVETPDPPAGSWDEIVLQPEPVLEDDGYYDALALSSGIGIGESVSGFAVSFDWLGTGQPGSQYYEIVHPVTFVTIDYGYTVPEPTTLFLLGFGGLVLRRKKISHEKARKKI